MKFLYYLVSESGEVYGTNDLEQAQRYKELEFTVIYTQTGTVIKDNNRLIGIKEAVTVDESGCEEEPEEDGDLEG